MDRGRIASLRKVPSRVAAVLSSRPRALLLAALALLAFSSAACANGSYPLDFFYEMHYHQSFGSSEPPRLSPPAGAIPITGVEAPGSENPIAGESIQEGAALYAVNCLMCHGPLGKGDGPVLQTMMQDYGYVPLETLSIDLSSSDPGHAQNISDRAAFDWISNGAVVMPQFSKLLNVEERWILVNYVKGCLGTEVHSDCPAP